MTFYLLIKLFIRKFNFYLCFLFQLYIFCNNINTIYIFKIMLENKKVVWKNKIIKINEISTQSGVIPSKINKNGYWELKYGGDYDFYKKLADKYHFIFIDKIIYQKIG